MRVSFDDFGCDVLIAGCHKRLFGRPRGTGVVIGSYRGSRAVAPTIPNILFTLGGFKALEHVWALSEAFDLHR